MMHEIKDRREVVHQILMRWCNWPVSIAFEQWKEYLQMVKVKRSKVRVVGQRSDVLLMQRMFCHWRRRHVLARRAVAHRVSSRVTNDVSFYIFFALISLFFGPDLVEISNSNRNTRKEFSDHGNIIILFCFKTLYSRPSCLNVMHSLP
jgi:hypothetical protein